MPDRIHRILRQHVLTDALLGVDAVPVAGAAPVVDTPRQATPTAAAVAPAPAPQTAPAPAPVRTAASTAPLDRATRLAVLQKLDEQEVRTCTRCPLHRGRTQTVFGEGDPDASIMFVGEGPGQNEDEQGRPFVGRAGEKLNEMIKAMGLAREQVYIANIVKCRPPNNRAPLAPEVDACSDYLRRQIETIQPKVIVSLGGPATKHLLRTDRGITSIRGMWHSYESGAERIPVMPTFHPAYLLRAYTRENRQKVWSDLQKVMQQVGLNTKP